MFTAPVFWFAASVVFFALEMLAPAGAFLFFGAGCLAGWVAALLDLSVVQQFLAAIAVCVVTLIVLRRRLGRVFSGFSGEKADDGRPFDAIAGAAGEVTAAIEPGREGQVRVQGSYWRAVCDEALAPGERVTVCGTARGDAQLLLVKRG
ncbi:MAG: NfeD family protein [Desulfovibrionaceae bacterium]|nr:NfeD family protein [Desulfovibrionaceae bacterium]